MKNLTKSEKLQIESGKNEAMEALSLNGNIMFKEGLGLRCYGWNLICESDFNPALVKSNYSFSEALLT